MITYTSDLSGITQDGLAGFFEGWAHRPSPDQHLRAMRGGLASVLAFDGETVAGFATASGDGVLFAYISLVEVRAQYRGQGIGTEMVRRLIDLLGAIYGIDTCCDPELAPFYERLGMSRVAGMVRRNFEALGVGQA